MLHTRKKAEIEVVYSIKDASDDGDTTNPLIRYLVHKINSSLEP